MYTLFLSIYSLVVSNLYSNPLYYMYIFNGYFVIFSGVEKKEKGDF